MRLCDLEVSDKWYTFKKPYTLLHCMAKFARFTVVEKYREAIVIKSALHDNITLLDVSCYWEYPVVLAEPEPEYLYEWEVYTRNKYRREYVVKHVISRDKPEEDRDFMSLFVDCGMNKTGRKFIEKDGTLEEIK